MRSVVYGVLALGLLTAGCGSNVEQRSATGGLTGVGVGALVGGPVGAVVGGVVGAAGGAAAPEGADTMAKQAFNKTREAGQSALNDVGLGTPRTAAAGTSEPQAADNAPTRLTPAAAQTTRDAQRELKREGLYQGKIDGIDGPQTRQAITAFQSREGLRQTASLDRETMNRLHMAENSPAQASATRNNGAMSGTSTASMLSPSQLRQKLSQEGYSNIADLRHGSGNEWTAQAERDGQQLSLRVDGTSGRVIDQQALTASQQPPTASSGSSSPGSGANPAANSNAEQNQNQSSNPGNPPGPNH